MRSIDPASRCKQVVERTSPDQPPEPVIGLSIRIFGEDGPFDKGTHFELLADQRVVATARTDVDGILLFPVQLGDSPGLVLRKVDQGSPKKHPETPRGPELDRWLWPLVDQAQE